MPQYQADDPRLIPEILANKTGPIPDDVKLKIKEKILETLGQTQNVQISCEAAGITRTTYANWVRNGFLSQEELDEALEKYRDFLRGEIMKRFLRGERKPLLQNGRVVKDDNNQPIWVDHPDSKLLVEVARRMLPEWATAEKGAMQTTLASGIPAQYDLHIDARKLTLEEFTTIRQIVLDIEARENGVIVVDALP